MKKEWKKPEIIVEQFVANEYIAACGDSGKTYYFECNAGEEGHTYSIKNENNQMVSISGYYYYSPCHDTHEASSDSGFLKGYHIDDTSTKRTDENIKVIIWTENGRDVHCTTNLDENKWVTTKS